MDKNNLLKELNNIEDVNMMKGIVDLKIIKHVTINEQNKRVYVLLDVTKDRKMQQFIEESVRQKIREQGYDPEIEIIN